MSHIVSEGDYKGQVHACIWWLKNLREECKLLLLLNDAAWLTDWMKNFQVDGYEEDLCRANVVAPPGIIMQSG